MDRNYEPDTGNKGFCRGNGVNGGVKTCHRGGAKAGQLVGRLGA
jgi:hypothetical protein